MLLYTTLGTNDLPRARRFHDATLATLGIARLTDSADEAGYGPAGQQTVRLYITRPFDQAPATRANGSMLALNAPSRAAVRAFHAAALAAGGTDEGAPGLRYRANFYACYIRDPDGHKLSAVCEAPE